MDVVYVVVLCFRIEMFNQAIHGCAVPTNPKHQMAFVSEAQCQIHAALAKAEFNYASPVKPYKVACQAKQVVK